MSVSRRRLLQVLPVAAMALEAQPPPKSVPPAAPAPPTIAPPDAEIARAAAYQRSAAEQTRLVMLDRSVQPALRFAPRS